MELSDIRGLGPARLKALREAGIHTVRDLLMRLPSSYKDTEHPQPVASLHPGQPACVEGYLKGSPTLARFSGKTMVSVQVADESGVISCRWFNQPWMKDLLRPEGPLLLYGRVGEFRGKKVLVSPSLEKERALLAQYRPIPGIPQKTYAGYVREALPQDPGIPVVIAQMEDHIRPHFGHLCSHAGGVAVGIGKNGCFHTHFLVSVKFPALPHRMERRGG